MLESVNNTYNEVKVLLLLKEIALQTMLPLLRKGAILQGGYSFDISEEVSKLTSFSSLS